jgi:hypothetical protein
MSALRSVASLGAIAILLAASDATAQPSMLDPRPLAAPRAAPRQQAPQSAPAPPAAPVAQVAPKQNPPIAVEQALYLIRSTLLTLNDANRSGNYTVLRDLAAPGFQEKNSAADLAVIFTELRRRNFDLFAVALAAPQLTATPVRDDKGMLRLTGLFPTRPQQINFDLLFQDIGGQWRLFGIAVQTPDAPPLPQAQQQGATPATPKRAPTAKP